MKRLRNILLACALVVGVTGSAFADSTTIQTTTSGQNGSTTTTTSTTSAMYIVNNDAAVIASLAALNECYSRYDRMIFGILNHSQRTDFAAMEKHGDWFWEHPLDADNRNGYLAYLGQRLHLDADQEREAARIEGHFLVDAQPLWQSYQTALASAWTAYRESHVSRVTTSTSTSTEIIAAPAVEARTTTVVQPERVEVKSATVKTTKRFIRNQDVK